MARTVLPLLAGLLLLAPAPALAQSPSPSPSPTPSPTWTPYAGPDDCRGEDRGFGSWSSSLTPRSVVAGEPATYTVVVRGPVHRAQVGLSFSPRTPYGGRSWEGTEQTQTGDAFPLTAQESATFTAVARPSLSGTFSRGGAVYCGPGGFHGDVGGADPQELRVAPRLTLSARREAPRRYVFSGTASRRDQLLSLYRLTAEGREVLTAQTRAQADGTWSLRRTFLGSGRFGLVLRTAHDDASDAGQSRVRPTVVH